MLALSALPRHIPLALLISLLAAYVVYLLTANRMSLSYHIGHAITHREFRVYCQPIIQRHRALRRRRDAAALEKATRMDLA